MSAPDARSAWITRVLGYDFGTPQGAPMQAMYNDLRPGVLADLQALARTNRAAAAPIAQQVAEAAQAATQGKFERAVTALNAAAEAIARATQAARAGEAAATVPKGTVASMRDLFERAASRWDQALAAAQASARSFQRELAASHPKEADGLGTIIESYWADLSEPLKNGGDESARLAVLQRLAALRGEMASDELFAYLDKRGVGVSAAYGAALDEVQKLLAA
jgi:hypothetical protein